MNMKKLADAVAPCCLAAMTAAIVAAWCIQAFGYEPCVLCLRQRIPYYVGVPLLVAFVASRKASCAFRRTRAALALAILVSIGASTGLAGYHAGVEEGLWEGPSTCVSRSLDTSSLDAFAAQIGGTKLVSCSTPTFTLLGASLSWWNLALSAAMLAAFSASLLPAARRP